MNYSNLFFLLFLLCSNSHVFSVKVNDNQQPVIQPQNSEKKEPNIYLGSDGILQSVIVDGVELLGSELNDKDQPTRMYNYPIAPGSKITITVMNKREETRGIAAVFKYKNSKGEELLYTTNDFTWECNDDPADQVGTIGSNDEYNQFLQHLRGVPVIWKEGTDAAICSVQLPTEGNQEENITEEEASSKILIGVTSSINSLTVNGENILPEEFVDKSLIGFDYELKEGDIIRISIKSNEEAKDFAARFAYNNIDGKQEILMTNDQTWVCDGKKPHIIGPVGESDKVPDYITSLRGIPAIWGNLDNQETICETIIPRTKLPETEKIEQSDKATQQQKQNQFILDTSNIILGVDDTLVSLTINGKNIVENIAPGDDIKKYKVELKEGDEIEAHITNEFGGVKGFAGIFYYENDDGELITLTTNNIDWTCDGEIPTVQEIIGQGVFWDSWKSQLEGVPVIWGKAEGVETTCKTKLQVLRGGITYGADPKMLEIKLNGENLEIPDRDSKDFSEIRTINANIKYGDNITFILPKENTFTGYFVAEKDGKNVKFPIKASDFVCEGIKTSKKGIVGRETGYDKCWNKLSGYNLLTMENEDPEKETIECTAVVTEKNSFVFIGTSGVVRELQINQIAVDTSKMGQLDNPAIVKRFDGEIQYGDTLTIIADKAKGHAIKDLLAAKIFLYQGPEKYDIIYTNNYAWECNNVDIPNTYGEVSDDNDYPQWIQYLSGATQIWGSQKETRSKCSITLSKAKAHLFVAAKGGLSEFLVNDKKVEDISLLFSNNPEEVKDFSYALNEGDNITIVAKKADVDSGIAVKLTLPKNTENEFYETNTEEWFCNNEASISQGKISDDNNYAEFSEKLKDIEVITSSTEDEYIKCTTTLKKYKSKIRFSVKDELKAILINGEPLELNLESGSNNFPTPKEVELYLKLGDEIKIITYNKETWSWHGMIAVIFYKYGTPFARTYYSNENDWTCGVRSTEVVQNEFTLGYWDNYYFGAKPIWEKETEFVHKMLSCKTVLQ